MPCSATQAKSLLTAAASRTTPGARQHMLSPDAAGCTPASQPTDTTTTTQTHLRALQLPRDPAPRVLHHQRDTRHRPR